MANEDKDSRQGEPGRASKLALEAAAQIADWCERRKVEALDDAKQQIRTIWILLGGGVVLLLLLPRFVALIDYTAATLPPDAVKEAAAALTLMETNETEMQAELAQADADLKLRETEFLAAEAKQRNAANTFELVFDDPLAVWQRTGPDDVVFEIISIAEPNGFGLIAVGRETIDDGNKKTLLLRSPHGETWTPIRPDKAGVRIAGQLNSLASAPDGALIAAGWEETDDGIKTLILRSPDAETWTAIHPDDAGVRIAGQLNSLVSARDGALIAAGTETTDHGDKTLILRSSDAETWTTIHPDDAGVRIAGNLTSMAPGPVGTLVAVGNERTDDGDEALILRSMDGETWTPLRPVDEGIRIGGLLLSLASAPDGELIAAGFEDTDGGIGMLMLHSSDAENWSPIRPSEAGNRIEGIVGSVAWKSDGGLIATGREGSLLGFNPETALLRSSDGQNWSPLRLEMKGERIGGSFFALHHRSDGTLFISSVDSRLDDKSPGLLRTTPTENEYVTKALREGEPIPDFAVPIGTAEHAEELRQSTREADIARERAKQQREIRDQAAASHGRQTDAVAEIRKANKNLEDALRRTDPLRQASWIATRLAVIALLIFLVQIVVNRYRYLQRLADFYDGRAQAFRMLAISGPTAAGSILHEISLNDLLAGLSPSAISFGREAEPPTQQLMSILQTAVKK